MSQNPINDGGPAFPVCTRKEDVDGGYGHQDSPSTYQFGGMTLRDYLAANAPPLSDEVSAEWAEAITGMERPASQKMTTENVLEWERFWAAAEATNRYIYADAMLRAREVQP